MVATLDIPKGDFPAAARHSCCSAFNMHGTKLFVFQIFLISRLILRFQLVISQ